MSKQDKPRGFLNRWSARKQAGDTLPDTTAENVLADDSVQNDMLSTTTPLNAADLPAVSGSAAKSSDQTDDAARAEIDKQAGQQLDEQAETLLSDADMPPIDTLDANSDISAFFSKGVSAALRKAALRHVFQQPSYNVRDGLNDYDGDFTSFEPLGDTITSDMKFHAARKEKARLEAEELAREEARLEEERLASEASDAEESAAQPDTDEDAAQAEDDPQIASAPDARNSAESGENADVESSEAPLAVADEDDSGGPVSDTGPHAPAEPATQAEAGTPSDNGPDVAAHADPHTRKQDHTAG